MSILIILNIIFTFVSYSMFVSDYHRKEPYSFNLFLFVMNALVSLYAILNHFGLLK